MAEETIILNFEIDQGDALNQLKRSEKAISDLKKSQTDLNKAYKEGTVTEDEYYDQKIQLDRQLKAEASTRTRLNKIIETESNSLEAQRQRLSELTLERNRTNQSTTEGIKRFSALQKEIKSLSDTIKESEQAGGDFRRNVGNYGDALKEAAGNASVAGVSVSDLGGKIASFANPVTAAVGVLGALGAAYAGSVEGAKDLTFATNLLSNAFASAQNSYGSYVKSLSGEDDIGFLSKAALALTAYFTSAADAAAGAVAAQLQQQQAFLDVSLTRAQGFAKDFERIAEDARRIRDNDEKELQDRLRQTNVIEQNLNAAGIVRINILKEQLEATKQIAQVRGELDTPQVQQEIAARQTEIKDIQEEINGKLTENITARQAILKLIQEQARIEDLVRRNTNTGDIAGVNTPGVEVGLQEVKQAELTQDAVDQIRYDAFLRNKRLMDEQNEYFAIKEQERLGIAQNIAGNIASIFEQDTAAYKVLSSAQALINTYLAATAAFASGNKINYVYGVATAAATVAAGLASVAKINGVQFAEGGYTGDGAKYQPAGVVHKGEYVVPAHIVSNPKYRGTIGGLEHARMKGYADGGLVTSSISGPVNEAFATRNVFKDMPQPVVSVKEITDTQVRVKVKQTYSRL